MTVGTHSWSYPQHNVPVDRSFNMVLQSKWLLQMARAAGYIHITIWQCIEVLNVILQVVRAAGHIHIIIWQSIEVLFSVFLHLVRTVGHIRIIIWQSIEVSEDLTGKVSTQAGTHSWSYSHHNLTVDRSVNVILQIVRTAGHTRIIIWQPIKILMLFYIEVLTWFDSWYAQLVIFAS